MKLLLQPQPPGQVMVSIQVLHADFFEYFKILKRCQHGFLNKLNQPENENKWISVGITELSSTTLCERCITELTQHCQNLFIHQKWSHAGSMTWRQDILTWSCRFPDCTFVLYEFGLEYNGFSIDKHTIKNKRELYFDRLYFEEEVLPTFDTLMTTIEHHSGWISDADRGPANSYID